MGLRGNLPIFIGNFLADRTFQIHLGTIRNHGEKLSLYQFPNLERIVFILLIIDLLLSQIAYVKLLKEWSMNALFGIWKRMVYWLNSVVIGQIDPLLIT